MQTCKNTSDNSVRLVIKCDGAFTYRHVKKSMNMDMDMDGMHASMCDGAMFLFMAWEVTEEAASGLLQADPPTGPPSAVRQANAVFCLANFQFVVAGLLPHYRTSSDELLSPNPFG